MTNERKCNKATESFSLSVMECVLVWEFILLSRRQKLEVTSSQAHRTELKNLVHIRESTLKSQCELAEALMLRAHMPIPSGNPSMKKDNLVCNDRFLLASLLRLTEKRISSLSYIIGSQITNSGLRTISKEWLDQEALLLKQIAFYAVKESTGVSAQK